jgi:hypothetical protein
LTEHPNPYRSPWLAITALLLSALVLCAGGFAHGSETAGDDSAKRAYADVWGPALGAALPRFQAPDQDGRMRSLDDLAGDRGLLLFLIRSADW